eukprot:11556456-Alexandrium_andersonii.AAC.1
MMCGVDVLPAVDCRHGPLVAATCCVDVVLYGGAVAGVRACVRVCACVCVCVRDALRQASCCCDCCLMLPLHVAVVLPLLV